MPFPYRGRFAPSPTGPLHFGSLIAALGSCLDARQQGGTWLLRMEDVDTSRNVPGAADDILRTLAAFGFEWDGPVLYQSQRLAAYGAALEQLKQAGLAYGCACSRKEIADSATHAAIDGGLAYPGTCRKGLPDGRAARAWRLRVDNGEVAFIDRLQGRVVQHLEDDVGDFVLRRADGLFAYQLAVVVDDAWQGITDVVRGADLLASTPRHWRHSAPAANVATRATVIMAVSKAAPDWCPHAPRLRLVRCPPRGLQPALGAARRRSGTCVIARLRSPAAPNPRSAAQPAPGPAPG